MENHMSALACCFWWFLLGLFLGWLLNWLLSNWLRKDNDGSSGSGSGGGSGIQAAYAAHAAPTPAPAPVPAARMLSGGIDIAAAAAAGFSIKGADDIIIIEGIGPKIAALFNEHGVRTFEQVSKLSVAEMTAILDKGGPRFKLANPGSWAEQARLAANNEWAALSKLQDELYAGVVPAADGKA
jgi:predicted flap endonuclease-1-like 5' DNA nuclease